MLQIFDTPETPNEKPPMNIEHNFKSPNKTPKKIEKINQSPKKIENIDKTPKSIIQSFETTPLKTPPSKPKKQGLIFSLDLGQNNGPFLLKDISHSNKKSVRLLLNSQDSKRVVCQETIFLEGTHSNKIDLKKMNKIFVDWEELIEAKLGIKKTTIFKLTDPSNDDIEDLSEKVEEKMREEMDLSNVDERYKTKLANIENITNEIVFHMVFIF